ncbi:MAG: hypothetical protein AAFP84_17945 [Actinomycetota bacterium]
MNAADSIVLVVALASTWAMAGVIWVIQLVHYPIFDSIDRGDDGAGWVRFGDRHRRSISLVVGPFMAAEGATGLWLVADPPADVSRVLPVLALGLMAIAYGVTAFVSVPLHERLTHVFDESAHRRLVTTNWWRTAAWTTRGIVLAVLAVIAM